MDRLRLPAPESKMIKSRSALHPTRVQRISRYRDTQRQLAGGAGHRLEEIGDKQNHVARGVVDCTGRCQAVGH